MCTRVLWGDAAGAVLVGRSMDYGVDLQTNLWVFPRGQERDDAIDGTLRWTSRLGSLAAGTYDVATAEGLNEAGLAGHLLWLSEADYGERDERRPALAVSVWLQYVLDTFASVADAVAWIEDSQVQVVSDRDPGTGRPVTVHLALDDASGDSAIVEYLDGSPRVWHGREHAVLTNSPPYVEQLRLLGEIEGFGGSETLPGGTDAPARFARAAFYLARLPEPASRTEAVAALLSVMRNASQPFRLPDPEQPFASTTLWRTVTDLSDRVLVFESTRRPNIVWCRLDGLDLSEGAPARRLDLVADTGLEGGLVGDVTGAFEESPPMRFLRVGEA